MSRGRGRRKAYDLYLRVLKRIEQCLVDGEHDREWTVTWDYDELHVSLRQEVPGILFAIAKQRNQIVLQGCPNDMIRFGEFEGPWRFSLGLPAEEHILANDVLDTLASHLDDAVAVRRQYWRVKELMAAAPDGGLGN